LLDALLHASHACVCVQSQLTIRAPFVALLSLVPRPCSKAFTRPCSNQSLVPVLTNQAPVPVLTNPLTNQALVPVLTNLSLVPVLTNQALIPVLKLSRCQCNRQSGFVATAP
jgi:hypothetical protein